ncbi:MAG: hypothetical protein NVSMB55_10850 [Mycobacteriales bacterium]
MTADDWARTTFAGTEQAQAQIVADLTPDARLELLEQLLEIAEASGALRLAREAKQQTVNDLWNGARSTPKGHAGGTKHDP